MNNNTKFFELMGDINDKYFAENYEEPLRAERVTITRKSGVKRWIIPVSIATAACLAVGIAAPRIADMIRGRNALEHPSTSGISGAGDTNSANTVTLRDWLALPHNAINSADKSVMFSSALTEDDRIVLTFDSDTASDIYAVDDCTVKYAGYANAPYLGYVVLVQFDNGLWGMYRNSYKHDDSYGTEISVKDGDKLKAGDKIGTMYSSGFKLQISAKEPSAELFTPKYPELAEWEKRHSTLPVSYHNPYSEDPAPETLTENLGYRGWHTRFYFVSENEPAYAVSDGTVYSITDRTYPGKFVTDNEKPKSVVIKLDIDSDQPLYAIYNYLDPNDLKIKVGDTVKEGDVIGKAYFDHGAAPVGMTLTISTVPYVPEVDEDGNIVIPPETISLNDWLYEPHHSVYGNEENVTLTPDELSDNRAELTIPVEGHDSRDVYAIADCTVTHVGYANAPYLGKVVIVDFGNGLFGMYRNPYDADDYGSVKISVSEGDNLKAGDKIGTMCPSGFKLVIGSGEFYKNLIIPKYPKLAKWETYPFTDPIKPDGVLNPKREKLTENLGYRGWYRDFWYVGENEPVYAVMDGTIYAIYDNDTKNNGSKSVVIEIDTGLNRSVYAIYDYLDPTGFTLNVGDKVKQGDVIGTAYEDPGAAPVGLFLTISATPYIPEMDEDGNIISSFN